MTPEPTMGWRGVAMVWYTGVAVGIAVHWWVFT